MAKLVKEETFLFHTDLGAVVTKVFDYDNYDIEDVVRDKAKEQALIIQFERLAAEQDINALVGPRTLKTSFGTGV